MKTRVFPIRFLASAAALTLGAATASADPTIQVNPTEIELGVVESGGRFERFVEVSNSGDGVLVITDVKTSCGCTAAAVDGIVELSAGQSQKVRVTFDTKGMDGHVQKNVIISSTDPALPKVIVPIIADVHMPIRWLPRYVSLNKLGVKMPFEQKVELQADPGLELEVTDQFVLGGALKRVRSRIFDVEPQARRDTDDRDVYEFIVRLREGVKPRKISETLCVLTNLEAPQDTLRVPIRGEIAGRLRVMPNFAVLRMVEPGQETARDLTVSSVEGAFSVLSAEVADSPVTTEIHTDENGRQVVIRLFYTGEKETINGVRTLTIETDDPDQRFIEVPVRYQTRVVGPKSSTRAAAPKTNKGP